MSPLPPPAVVYFFHAGALCGTENAKFGPILAILSGGVPKLINIRYETDIELEVPEECDQAS